MLKKLKNKLKKANNRGSSFVLVIVSTTFMAILVSALLMGVLLAYRLKLYKLNSLNNFYSVEKAMDEIYAGVGASVNEHLYSAYSETAELVVYYDGTTSAYTSLDETTANDLFKRLFMTGIYEDANFTDIKTVCSTLKDYITVEGVSLETADLRVVLTDTNGNTVVSKSEGSLSSGFSGDVNFDYDSIETVTLKNVTVRREIELASTETSTPGTYIQSITTDLTLTKPEYNVSFDISSSSSDSLYSYALLADMGLEVDGSSSEANVKVTGNIYTASDYYNKQYNADLTTRVTTRYDSSVTSLTTAVSRLATTNSSLYSGIYVQGSNASLSLLSDVVICAGSFAAFDGATISLGTISASTVSELWTDNIIIGGSKGGTITMKANAYVYDDTELNAESSSFTMYQGSRYFGYSYAATDTRSIALASAIGVLSSNFSLKSHFSDSSIIVNGKNSVLDISSANSLYIAGKSYIEFSKAAASAVSSTSEDDYGYEAGDEYVYSTVTDYSTGFSLDVKSNQLIYLANWEPADEEVEEGATKIKVTVPSTVSNSAELTKLYKSFLDSAGEYTYVIVQQSVSGHTYYYLYVSETTDEDGNVTSASANAEQFARDYYELLSEGVVSDSLYNVANYEEFEVTLLLPKESSTYTAAAATNQDSNGLYIQEKTTTAAIVDTALTSASSNKVFAKLLGNLGTTGNASVLSALKTNSQTAFSGQTLDVAQETSNFLEYMYINMKDHLSVTNTEDESGNEVSAWTLVNRTSTNEVTDYSYSLTPLNYYVDYDYVLNSCQTMIKVQSEGLYIVVYAGDVKINFDKGIVICGGDVTFDDDISSFSGMIICGGKVICKKSVSISASATAVNAALQACYTSGDTEKYAVCTSVLKNFASEASDTSEETGGYSISDISYSDILCFENWKKNVTD